jgi:hypothetical protein
MRVHAPRTVRPWWAALSASHAGHAYELERLGTRGWFGHERNQIVLSRVNQGRSTTLLRGHWHSTTDPIHIYASLDDEAICQPISFWP